MSVLHVDGVPVSVWQVHGVWFVCVGGDLEWGHSQFSAMHRAAALLSHANDSAAA